MLTSTAKSYFFFMSTLGYFFSLSLIHISEPTRH